MIYSASVVTNQDELSRCFAIRSAVFLTEQNCPYDEEFDGNDFCALHVLGYADGQAAGTIRLRWFSDFAKMERVCVLPRYRNSPLIPTMLNFAFDVARRKGFRRVYGHAQLRFVNHWKKFGFEPLHKNTKLVFSDHEYAEMVCELAPDPEAISLATDPYIMLRPEGAWDEPSVLENSAARSATNPH